MANLTYAQLVQRFQQSIVQNGKLILQRAPAEGEVNDSNNYIDSDAINRVFDYVLGADNSLEIDLLAPVPPSYVPQVAAGVDDNGLSDALADGQARYANPFYDDVNQSIGVIGTGRSVLFDGMLVVAIFSVKPHGDGTVMPHLFLQASPQGSDSAQTDDWTLSTSFPELTPSIMFSYMEFVWQPPTNIPRLTLCTYMVSDDVPAALYFTGEAKLASVFMDENGNTPVGVGFLLGQDLRTLTQKLVGVITFPEHIATMSLRPPDSQIQQTLDAIVGGDEDEGDAPPINLGHLGDVPPAIVTLESRPLRGIPPNPAWVASTYATVNTAFTVTLGGRPVVLPISARVTTPLNPTLLRANLSAVWVSLTASPDELRALLDGVDISNPNTLDPTVLGDFSLSQRVIPTALYMQLNPNAATANTLINYLSLAIQNQSPWTIIDTGTALLKVDHAEIDITVYTPGVSTTRYWALTVTASLAIGRHDGVIGFAFGTETGESGQKYVTLSMVEGLITLQDVVGLLMGGGAVDLPDIALEEFTLYIDAQNKAYRGQFELVSNWYVDIGGAQIAITALMLSASYDTERGAALTLAGVLNMTGLFDSYIAVRASYPGRNMGWNFIGVVQTQTSIGELVDNIAAAYNLSAPSLPHIISQLTISQVRVTFNTRTRNFSFTVEAAWRDTTPSATLTLDIRRLAQGGDSAKLDLAGTLTFYQPDNNTPTNYIPAAEFGLIFDTDGQAGNAFAAYYQREQGATFSLYGLFSQLFDPSAMNEEQRSGFTFEVTEALIAYIDGTYVFGVGMGAALNLSALEGLPLIGDLFVGAPSLDLAAQLFYATQNLSQADLRRLNLLFKGRQRQLPQNSTAGLTAGLSITLQLWLDDGQPQTLPMPPTQKEGFPAVTPVAAPPTPTATTGAASHGVIWFQVQKAFGPLHISRFGLGFQRDSTTLSGHIDADIVVTPLTLSLMNLSLGFSFGATGFNSISYGLDGIGIQFRIDPLSLAGAFYHTERHDGGTEYDGYAMLGLGPLQLSAIGSYTQGDDGNPSLFVFAALDYPLGGLGFFFVNGLSAGFGFNRDLIMPSVSQVANYWLVQLADPSQAAPSSTPSSILNSAMAYVPPALGQYWLALGLRFTTYEIIQTLAVAALSFGQRTEVDVIGLSTIMIPPTPGDHITPLGEAQLALIGSFVLQTDPLAIDLMIQGQLTPSSHIFSRSCKLNGGFAFGAWLGGEYSGDFVVTFGGYHPSYKPPSHYPIVPRIGFTWSVSSLLNAKGSLYFALTPNAIMAGMSLSFLFQCAGDSVLPAIRASLDVGVDFLLNWKPYHYAVNTSAEVDVSVIFHTFGTHEVSASAGADLELWGPNLGGHAALHMKIWFVKINVDLTFGATNTGAAPLTWTEFQNALLPPVQAVPSTVDAPSGSTHWNYVTIDVTNGLVRQIQDNQSHTYHVVDPKNFSIMTSSAIPITVIQDANGVTWQGVQYGSLKRDGLGVTSMDTGYQSAAHRLILERKNDSTGVFETDVDDFATPQPYSKNVPYAMWGTKLLNTSKPSSVNQPSLIADTIGGIILVPATPVVPGSSQAVDRDKFAYETTPQANTFGWSMVGGMMLDPNNHANPNDPLDNRRVIEAVQTDMLAPDTQATRQSVLDALGLISETFNLNQDITQYAAFAPRYGAFSSHY